MLKNSNRLVVGCIAVAGLAILVFVGASSPGPVSVRFKGIRGGEPGTWDAVFLVTNHTGYPVAADLTFDIFSVRSHNPLLASELPFGTVRLYGIEFPNAPSPLFQRTSIGAHEAQFVSMPVTEKTNVARVSVDMVARRPSWQCKVIRGLAACHLYIYDKNGPYWGPTVLKVGGAMPRGGVSFERRHVSTNSWLLILP